TPKRSPAGCNKRLRMHAAESVPANQDELTGASFGRNTHTLHLHPYAALLRDFTSAGIQNITCDAPSLPTVPRQVADRDHRASAAVSMGRMGNSIVIDTVRRFGQMPQRVV